MQMFKDFVFIQLAVIVNKKIEAKIDFKLPTQFDIV